MVLLEAYGVASGAALSIYLPYDAFLGANGVAC